jgi:hypothetical protein
LSDRGYLNSVYLADLDHAQRKSYDTPSIEVRYWRSEGTETKSSMPFGIGSTFTSLPGVSSRRPVCGLQDTGPFPPEADQPQAEPLLRRARAAIAARRE